MHFIWVSMYLAQKYQLGTLFFTSPTGDVTAISRGHPSHLQGKGSTFISQLF